MEFEDITQVKKAVAVAIDFYNNERPHMSLNMMTPIEAANFIGPLEKKWVSYRDQHLKTEEQLAMQAVI